jgi:hypothetical protein
MSLHTFKAEIDEFGDYVFDEIHIPHPWKELFIQSISFYRNEIEYKQEDEQFFIYTDKKLTYLEYYKLRADWRCFCPQA